MKISRVNFFVCIFGIMVMDKAVIVDAVNNSAELEKIVVESMTEISRNLSLFSGPIGSILTMPLLTFFEYHENKSRAKININEINRKNYQ